MTIMELMRVFSTNHSIPQAVLAEAYAITPTR